MISSRETPGTGNLDSNFGGIKHAIHSYQPQYKEDKTILSYHTFSL